MGLIRYGDPYGFPDIDVMERRGLILHLDTVWRHANEAQLRIELLEKDGKTAYVIERYAPPEEVQSHFSNKGIPELGERVHVDEKYTKVYDVWVVVARKHRRKKKVSKPKPKRKLMKKSKHK
jgi:hypothetical protein